MRAGTVGHVVDSRVRDRAKAMLLFRRGRKSAVPNRCGQEVAMSEIADDRQPAVVTVERIERAIHTVALMMVKHDMDLTDTIGFLEAERDRLQQKTAAMDYARKIIANGRNKGRNIADLRLG